MGHKRIDETMLSRSAVRRWSTAVRGTRGSDDQAAGRAERALVADPIACSGSGAASGVPNNAANAARSSATEGTALGRNRAVHTSATHAPIVAGTERRPVTG